MCFVPQWMMGCVVKAILNLAVGESVLILTKNVCLVCLELTSITIVLHSYPIYIYPYGSKHLLRRYLTAQIIPQTLPQKVLGSIGYIYIYTYYTYHLVM